MKNTHFSTDTAKVSPAKTAKKKNSPRNLGAEAVKALKEAIKAKGIALKAISKAQGKPLVKTSAAKESPLATEAEIVDLNNPLRVDVKPKVIHEIAEAAVQNGANHGNVLKLVSGDEALDLEDDLNLNGDLRERLSGPYSKISIGDYHGSGVGAKESKKAKKVGEAIDLVHKRSNEK